MTSSPWVARVLNTSFDTKVYIVISLSYGPQRKGETELKISQPNKYIMKSKNDL